MKLKLTSINLDPATQCRAEMRQEVIDEYAERMRAGDVFPPIEAYGTKAVAFLADGWHRVLAARQVEMDYIEANLLPGGRGEAIKAGLKANALHGLRRSNEDKRKAVAVTLREFKDQNLSSRQIAELCGVHHDMVDSARKDVAESATSPRTDTLGRQQPATKPKAAASDSDPCSKCNHPRSEHFKGGQCQVLLTPGRKESECACGQFVARGASPKPEADKPEYDFGADQAPDASRAWRNFQDDAVCIAEACERMEELAVPVAATKLPGGNLTKAAQIVEKLAKRLDKLATRIGEGK